ncbi:reverse transcriptase domain-containing protein [Tanacetum coccineum]
MVRALLLDKQTSPVPAPAPVKAVEQSCVTCGGAHSYRNCPTTNGNNYRDNIQEYVSQAAAANFNLGNSGYRPPPDGKPNQTHGFSSYDNTTAQQPHKQSESLEPEPKPKPLKKSRLNIPELRISQIDEAECDPEKDILLLKAIQIVAFNTTSQPCNYFPSHEKLSAYTLSVKLMNEAESRYTTTEKEMLAVVYAFEKFRSYLVMNKCTVYTDHSASISLAKKDSKGEMLRWFLLPSRVDLIVTTKGAET